MNGDSMKLFLKRDCSEEHSRFTVSDESGFERYRVTGKRTASTDRMALSSPQGELLVKIRIAPFHVFYAFSISDSNERFSITAANIGNRTEYRFHGISWHLSRSSDGRSFEVLDADGSVIMTQNADRFLSTDVYTLDILSEYRELFCIAVAVCADVINYADSAAIATV